MEAIERHREKDWAGTKDRETTRMKTWKNVEMLIEMQTVTTTVILDIDIESTPGEKEPKENCERPRMEPGRGEWEIEWRRRSTSRLDYLVNSETWASSLSRGEIRERIHIGGVYLRRWCHQGRPTSIHKSYQPLVETIGWMQLDWSQLMNMSTEGTCPLWLLFVIRERREKKRRREREEMSDLTCDTTFRDDGVSFLTYLPPPFLDIRPWSFFHKEGWCLGFQYWTCPWVERTRRQCSRCHCREEGRRKETTFQWHERSLKDSPMILTC